LPFFFLDEKESKNQGPRLFGNIQKTALASIKLLIFNI